MKLITETTHDIEVISEAKENKDKTYTIRGIFLQGSKRNKNGRVYPQDLLDERVNDYINSRVKSNRALGELGHPTNPAINLDRVSHKITKLEKDGNNWIGTAKIMNTPMGKIVQNLIDEGVQIGVSSRGLGTLTNHRDGYKLVNDDFRLVTAADIVYDPSAPDAFVEGIMEGTEWIEVNGKYLVKHAEIVEDTQEQIDRIYRTTQRLSEEREIALAKAFEDFLNRL